MVLNALSICAFVISFKAAGIFSSVLFLAFGLALRISIHNVSCSSLPVTAVNAPLATSLLNFQPVGCIESGSIICIYFTESASLKSFNVIVALSSANTAVHIDSTITAATNNAPIFLNKFFIRFAPFFLCIFLFRPSSAIYN